MAASNKSTNLRTMLLCFVCTFFWGMGYPVVKMSYKYWEIANSDVASKLLFAGIRFIISGGILIFIASFLKKGFACPNRRIASRVMLLGLCQTVSQYGLLYIGMAFTTGTKSSVLNQFNVFLLVLLTPIFFNNEKITLKKIVGCIFGFAGIVIMNLNGLSFALEFGDIIVIASSCTAAVGYLLSKSMPTGESPITITAYQQLFGGVILLASGLIGKGKLTVINQQGVLCLVLLVMVAAVGYSVWFYLLQHNDVTKISIYKFLTPVIGVTLSGMLLKEKVFTYENIAALILVCIGIIVVNSYGKLDSTKHST